MKIRHGFVSNSSSASFVVDLSWVKSEKKKKKVIKQIQSCPYNDQGGGVGEEDHWRIFVEGERIEGNTWMDNYDFPEYIKKVFRKVFGDKRWEREYDLCVKMNRDT